MDAKTIKTEYMHMTEPASSAEKAITRFSEIVELLRRECPWDIKQTHRSLRPCMIEEAYEAAEAIDNDDSDNLKEELGDVLLQVLFHASLAKEENKFDFTDLVNAECEKMIRRHPHVFLDEKAKTVDKVLEKWENIKDEEHKKLSYTAKMEGIPKALPALIRSYKVQKKAAQAGFDWDDVSCALDKVKEETKELEDAYTDSVHEEIVEEIGDLLFAAVNVSRFMGVEPESALEAATEKFTRRFAYIEDRAGDNDRKLEEMDLEEMDRLWEEAKRKKLLMR